MDGWMHAWTDSKMGGWTDGRMYRARAEGRIGGDTEKDRTKQINKQSTRQPERTIETCEWDNDSESQLMLS